VGKDQREAKGAIDGPTTLTRFRDYYGQDGGKGGDEFLLIWFEIKKTNPCVGNLWPWPLLWLIFLDPLV